MQNHERTRTEHQYLLHTFNYTEARLKGLKKDKKLDWVEVDEIRRSYVRFSKTDNMNALAQRYGVSQTTISKILRGITWRVIEGDGHVQPPLPVMSEPARMKAIFKNLSEIEAMHQSLFEAGHITQSELDRQALSYWQNNPVV